METQRVAPPPIALAVGPHSPTVGLKEIAEKDSVDALKGYIKNKKNSGCLAAVDANQRSLLMLLILSGAKHCALHLLKEHAKDLVLQQLDCDRRSAFHYACMAGRQKLSEEFMTLRVSPFEIDDDGFSPFHYAVQNSMDIVEDMVTLTKQHGDETAAAKRLFEAGKLTPLHVAATSAEADCLKQVLDCIEILGLTTVHIPDELGRTPCHMALEGQNALPSCRLLLKSEEASSSCDIYGRSALSMACQQGLFDVALLLLEQKANPNTGLPNPLFQTFVSTAKGAEDFLVHLKKHQVDPHVPVDKEIFLDLIAALDDKRCLKIFQQFDQETPQPPSTPPAKAIEFYEKKQHLTHLHAIVLEPAVDWDQLLQNTSPREFNSTDSSGKTPFLTVCEKGSLQACRRLAASSIDHTICDNLGNTPLLAALHARKRQIAYFLLLHQLILIDKANHEGETPLLYMVKEGSSFWVQLLIKFAANAKMIDKRQHSAFHYLVDSTQASRAELRAICEVLVKQGVNINFPNAENQTPLEYAWRQRNRVVFQILLDFGAKPDPEHLNPFEETLLSRICMETWGEGARALILAGANRNPSILECENNTATRNKKSLLLRLCEMPGITLSQVKLIELLFAQVHQNKSPPSKPADPDIGSETEVPLTAIVKRICLLSTNKEMDEPRVLESAEFRIFQLILSHGAQTDVRIGPEPIADYISRHNLPRVARELQAYQKAPQEPSSPPIVRSPPHSPTAAERSGSPQSPLRASGTDRTKAAESPPPSPVAAARSSAASRSSSPLAKPAAASPKQLSRGTSVLNLGKHIIGLAKRDKKETEPKEKEKKKDKKSSRQPRRATTADAKDVKEVVGQAPQLLAERGEQISNLQGRTSQMEALAKQLRDLTTQGREGQS